jgi:hypothetical protein
MVNTSDSKLIDRALEALLQELDGRHELEAIAAQPYEDDPDLAWATDPGPSLPYDDDVPPEVLRLAERRAHNTELR